MDLAVDGGYMRASRSVWARVRPQGSGTVHWGLVRFLSRLLVRVRSKTSASAIVYTFRAHYRRAIETLFQPLMMSRYRFMSCCGCKLFSSSIRSGHVLACVLAYSQYILMILGVVRNRGKRRLRSRYC